MSLLLAFLILTADFEGTARTNVPVYAEKSVEGRPVGSLRQGEIVSISSRISGEDGSWCSVMRPGQQQRLGYLHCEELDIREPQPVVAPAQPSAPPVAASAEPAPVLRLSPHAQRSSAAIELRNQFMSACPPPAWWDRVDIGGVQISTYGELMSYWQDRRRTNPQFFKAAYQAIIDYPLDTDVVATAISLMPNGDPSYPSMTSLLEFAAGHYFRYQSPGNENRGSTIGFVVEDLAWRYVRDRQFDRAIALVERLKRERVGEMNDHMWQLVHLPYAAALDGAGRTADAVATLQAAIRHYPRGDWKKRIDDAIREYDAKLASQTASH